MLESPEWHTLELGKGTPSEVYKVLAESFAVTEDALQETVRQVSSTITLNDDLVATIRRLRLDSGGHLRVFAATNMSKASYDIVRAKPAGWDIFDDVFTSMYASRSGSSLTEFSRSLVSMHSLRSSLTTAPKMSSLLSVAG